MKDWEDLIDAITRINWDAVPYEKEFVGDVDPAGAVKSFLEGEYRATGNELRLVGIMHYGDVKEKPPYEDSGKRAITLFFVTADKYVKSWRDDWKSD